MKNIKFLFLWFLCISCATQNTTLKPDRSKSEIHGVEAYSENSDPIAEPNTPPLPIPSSKSVYAVWIDAHGYDGFLALGLLQDWEKRGLKIAKISGTGFGCWIAMAIAQKNSMNFAEWQSLKFEKFSFLKDSGILRLKSPWDRFAEEGRRHFSQSFLRDFKSLVDCPVLPINEPFRLQSGRFLPVPDLVATQLFSPDLGGSLNSDSDRKWMTGALSGGPTQEELLDFSRDLPSIENPESPFGGWIILKTRAAREVTLKNTDLGAEVLAARLNIKQNDLPNLINSQEESPRGDPRFIIVDLRAMSKVGMNSFQKPSPVDLEFRRKWLLEGRSMGGQVWQRLVDQGFFAKSSPNFHSN